MAVVVKKTKSEEKKSEDLKNFNINYFEFGRHAEIVSALERRRKRAKFRNDYLTEVEKAKAKAKVKQ